MAHLLVLSLEGIFFVGLVGSIVVAIMAFVGDIHEFFEKDRSEGTSQAIGD
jgi:Na+/melibiose symporter-like transporter